ncbi:unnamed protein product [Pleuronectes platessa]|uniref:Uncharacterized protein n=1 Tax=Pleuronectes platessa TaxID=8262 RepID=A0A9N7TLP5_PLEPL|nr:unnamed protein product [Pleuronectes platessa]
MLSSPSPTPHLPPPSPGFDPPLQPRWRDDRARKEGLEREEETTLCKECRLVCGSNSTTQRHKKDRTPSSLPRRRTAKRRLTVYTGPPSMILGGGGGLVGGTNGLSNAGLIRDT